MSLCPQILSVYADVAYASLDYKVKVQYADTPYGYSLYNLDLVQAPCEWNQETVGTSNVAVCIIDSGIQTNHPDLAANVWVNTAEIPNNGIDDDGNGRSPDGDITAFIHHFFVLKLTTLEASLEETADKRCGHGLRTWSEG